MSRASLVKKVEMVRLDPLIDGDPASRSSRGKLPSGHSLWAWRFNVPQSYGVKGKEKGKMDRKETDCYPVYIVFELKDDDAKIVPAGPLGRSRANDGVLW